MIIEGDDVQKKVREAFGLDDNVKIVFQAYNDEWSEWCDIEGAEIQHMGKIRIVLQPLQAKNYTAQPQVSLFYSTWACFFAKKVRSLHTC